MKDKKYICKICNCEIKEDEPTFIFPKLHESLNLEYLRGKSHVKCLKKIDKKLEVSKLLATIREDITRDSDEPKLICRNGNITICARFDEKRVEIYDYKDFCSMSIPISDLEKIQGIDPYGKISIGKIEGQTLDIMTSCILRISSLHWKYELSELDLTRLREILSGIEIETYFGEAVQQEFIRKEKQRKIKKIELENLTLMEVIGVIIIIWQSKLHGKNLRKSIQKNCGQNG